MVVSMQVLTIVALAIIVAHYSGWKMGRKDGYREGTKNVNKFAQAIIDQQTKLIDKLKNKE